METALTVASIFTDHMVLQQGKRVPIWGFGPNGATVEVHFGPQKATVQVDHERWLLYLDPLPVGGPYEMEIRSAGESMILHDVWVGEVWLAAGQSNMVQQLLFTEGGVAEGDSADLPDIRLFTTPRRPFAGALVPGWDFIGAFTGMRTWQICSPQSALHFSAIGYHFGKMLQKHKNVPVGIISCNFGGTPIQAWMSELYLQRDPELKPILDAYEQYVGALDPQQYEDDFQSFIRSIYRLITERGDIEQRVRELGLDGYRQWIRQNPLILPDPPYGPKAYERPCGFYHTMLQTVAPYSIRGVLWYQGESNANRAEVGLYRKLLTAMIANWRADWHEPELPFLIVQLPAYASTKGPNGQYWAYIREAQEAVADSVPHTALVVTLDCGEHDIHPIYKRTVAERLFRAAQAVVYGESVEYKAPRFRCMTKSGRIATIDFQDVEDSLRYICQPIEGFVICGVAHHFVPAQARIIGKSVEVFSSEIDEPVAVRYAWQNMPKFSLIGQNGIPVAPFRTDTFAIE